MLKCSISVKVFLTVHDEYNTKISVRSSDTDKIKVFVEEVESIKKKRKLFVRLKKLTNAEIARYTKMPLNDDEKTKKRKFVGDEFNEECIMTRLRTKRRKFVDKSDPSDSDEGVPSQVVQQNDERSTEVNSRNVDYSSRVQTDGKWSRFTRLHFEIFCKDSLPKTFIQIFYVFIRKRANSTNRRTFDRSKSRNRRKC